MADKNEEINNYYGGKYSKSNLKICYEYFRIIEKKIRIDFHAENEDHLAVICNIVISSEF